MNDGSVVFVHVTSIWGKKKGREYWTVLPASVIAARSENGFIHVWNLKTHRVDAALDGHGRKSVCGLKTMDGKERLLRLVRQAKRSGKYVCSCYVPQLKKTIKSGSLLFLEPLLASPTHTENVQKYNYPELLWSVNFFMIHMWLHCSVTTWVS